MSRFSIQRHYPAMQPLIDLTQGVHARGRLEPALVELVLMRVSQINGCAFCLDMHSKDARAAGETEQRLHLLPAWRETRLYSDRERTALAWAESLTSLGSAEAVPDALYAEARGQFEEDALVDLTLLVVAINGFNRLNIAARTIGGSYKVAAR
jgi:AhpD family alkylhydroperoxidase